MKPFKHKNSILVAMPSMQDPFFSRTVIFLQEFTAEGAFGFIINKPDHRTLSDAIRLEGIEIPDYITTWFGGPVDTGVGVILSAKRDTHGDITGISVGTEAESVETLVDYQKTLQQESLAANKGQVANPYEHRFVIGYSGWASEQLESEIRAGGWMQLEFDAELCFHTPWMEMWERAIDRFGIDFSSLDTTSEQSYLN